MGYTKHDVVLVTVSHYVHDPELHKVVAPDVPQPDVELFRQSLPEAWRHLVIGPIPAIVNGYVHYVFLPDGSKEGWEESDAGDGYRRRFIQLFSWKHGDGSSPFEVVHVCYGEDEPALIVV